MGMSLPTNWRGARSVGGRSAEVRTKIEARPKERDARETAEHQVELAARDAKTGGHGQEAWRQAATASNRGASLTYHINLTDEDFARHAAGGEAASSSATMCQLPWRRGKSAGEVAVDVVRGPKWQVQLAPMLLKIRCLAEDWVTEKRRRGHDFYFSAATLYARIILLSR